MSESAGSSPPKDQDVFGNDLRLSGKWERSRDLRYVAESMVDGALLDEAYTLYKGDQLSTAITYNLTTDACVR